MLVRRLRKSVDAGPGPVTTPMETVVCGNCGQRFAIHNDANAASAELTEKRIAWVKDQLVWDHIQERKHHGSMELPDLK